MGQIVSAGPTTSERKAMERLRASLYDWYFCDLKKAASPEVDLPRLAFVGLASWIDAVARLYGGKKGDGFSAWRAFIHKYLPDYMHPEHEVRRLYDGLRSAMSHEYGTRKVLLTHASAEAHWSDVGDDLRVLDLHSLLNEFEEAFGKFYAELETNAELRAGVLPLASGLLAPVTLTTQVPSSIHDLFRIGSSIAASASAPPPHVIGRDTGSGT
jgi:hypothetical protein